MTTPVLAGLTTATTSPRADAPLLVLGPSLGTTTRLWEACLPELAREFRVLRFMVEHPNRVIGRQELVVALGKAGDTDYLRTVDVWIKRLRFGLKVAGAQSLLRTVHGRGYVLDLI